MAAQGNTKIIYAALFANGAIAITKFAASTITGSSAMFAEAIHSVVDTGNQGLLLLGLAKAKQPADADHPFGYGKEIYFYAFMVAIVIFAAGAGFAAYEGIHKLSHPEEVQVSWVNYAVLAAALAFESVAWWMAFKAFQKARGDMGFVEAVRRSKDPTLFTVLFEDTAAMLGLVIAFFGILAANLTGDPTWDAVATLAIAAVLALTAIVLAVETKGLLVGEAADPALVRELRQSVSAEPGVKAVNELLTMHFGPNEVLVTISADFDDALSAAELEATVSRLEERLKAEHAMVRRVFLEAQGGRGHRRAAEREASSQG